MEKNKIIYKFIEKFKEPFTYTIIAAFIIVCSCFYITIKQFKIEETYSIKTEDIDISSILNPETIIHQEININGNITEIELPTEGIHEGDKGTIKVLIKYSGGKYTGSFSFEEIFNNNQNILIKLTPNISGPIDIYISGKDIINAVSLKTSSEKSLGVYDVNGITQSGNLAINVKTYIVPKYTYLRICLLIIMLIIWGFHIYLYQFPRYKQENVMYWIAAAYIFCTICIRYPANTLLAEPYLETASNFFHQTLIRGFKGSFFLDDTGYWPILPRLIAGFVVLIVHQTKYAILIFAICCLICVVLVTAEIVKKQYDKFLFLEARFIIALLMGGTCYYQISQMLYLHNLGYLSIFIVILAFLNDLKNLSFSKWILLLTLTIVSTSSKTYYIGLIPLMFLVLFLKKKQIPREKALYCLICCIGPFFQILYLLSGFAEDNYRAPNTEIFHRILESCYTYIQCFFYFFTPVYNFLIFEK